MLNKEYWEQKHKDSEGRYNQVTDFARFCYYNFMKQRKGKVLDICCGKGADSIFFHNKGYKVTSLDYSGEAIQQFNATQKRYEIFISSIVKDVMEGLPFENDSFDYIYMRLGLHYFTDEELKFVISEISRVLKSEGLFMFQVKSTNDKEYGKGDQVEEDMFRDETGYVRHFFSKEYVESIIPDFHIVLNEERKIENGSCYLEVVSEKK